MTRSSKYKAKDHPTTTLRMPGGVCVNCYKHDTPPCTGCGAALRISSVPAELAPGTKTRYAEGMCKVCWILHNPDSLTVKEPEPDNEPVTPEKLAHTIRGLEAYMERRRQRIGAAA
jgi:hypothetical protein